MSRFARQFAAAASVYDHANEPEYPDAYPEEKIAAYAKWLAENDEIEPLVLELAEAGDEILNALRERQECIGRAPSYAATTAMQRIRAILKAVEA
jgi:hypothetical protein